MYQIDTIKKLENKAESLLNRLYTISAINGLWWRDPIFELDLEMKSIILVWYNVSKDKTLKVFIKQCSMAYHCVLIDREEIIKDRFIDFDARKSWQHVMRWLSDSKNNV